MTDAGDETTGDDEPGADQAVVLDYLPTGRPDDGRPQHKKSPVAYALGVEEFGLYLVEFDPEADSVTVGTRVDIDPRGAAVDRVRRIDFADLSGAANSELEYAVDELVESEEERFVDFYNDARAITTRLHALNLLPGIGKKLRNNVLDERKRKPFDSFAEMEERVAGLHDPKGVLVDRILEELQEEDLKYRIFTESGG